MTMSCGDARGIRDRRGPAHAQDRSPRAVVDADQSREARYRCRVGTESDSEQTTGVACGGCGLQLPASENEPALRRPCATCGSMARNLHRSTADSLTLHGGLGIKLVRGATGKVAQEQFVGASPSEDGSIAEVTMLRDYETGADVKRVVLEDGTLERDVRGDLRDHTGRGSDRPDLRLARESKRRQGVEERALRKAERDAKWREMHPEP